MLTKYRSPRNPDRILSGRIIANAGDKVTSATSQKFFVTIPTGNCWIEWDKSIYPELTSTDLKPEDSNILGPV